MSPAINIEEFGDIAKFLEDKKRAREKIVEKETERFQLHMRRKKCPLCKRTMRAGLKDSETQPLIDHLAKHNGLHDPSLVFPSTNPVETGEMPIMFTNATLLFSEKDFFYSGLEYAAGDAREALNGFSEECMDPELARPSKRPLTRSMRKILEAPSSPESSNGSNEKENEIVPVCPKVKPRPRRRRSAKCEICDYSFSPSLCKSPEFTRLVHILQSHADLSMHLCRSLNFELLSQKKPYIDVFKSLKRMETFKAKEGSLLFICSRCGVGKHLKTVINDGHICRMNRNAPADADDSWISVFQRTNSSDDSDSDDSVISVVMENLVATREVRKDDDNEEMCSTDEEFVRAEEEVSVLLTPL